MNLVWRIKRKFLHRRTPKINEIPDNAKFKATIGYNKYGAYCVPLLDTYRSVPQTILRGEVYEQETIQYILDNAKGTVVHAGAYFGDFLPALGKLPYKVYAFEPVTQHFRCAEITLKLNLNSDNINLVNYGLTNTAGIMGVTTHNNGVPNAGSSSMTDSIKNSDTIEVVNVTRLDSFIGEIENLSIVHLDVEGYEKEAVLGGLKIIERDRPILILEDNNGFIGSEEYIRTLHELGYRQTGKVNNNKILKCV